MDRNTKISIISVCMDKKLAKQLFNLWVTMLQEKFDKTEVQMDTNVQSVVKLKEKIVFFTDVNTTDAILIFGAQSLKNSIIEEIDKVSGAKTAIAQLFADIPVLLEPNFTTKFLYHAYHKNTLIFSVFGDESDIITAAKSAESIALATYLLRNIITRCNMSNYLSQGKNQIMSSSCSDQSSAPKGEEKEEMSTSPTSTSDKNIQTTDEANASAFTYQPIRLITGEDALQIIYVIIISAKRIPVQIETVNIKDALGRRLLEDQTCYSNVPSFSVATKNGYAVIADIEMRKMKRISKESNKINSIILDPVTTKWVNSGEFIPLGATAVIPEDNVAISTDDKGNEIKTTSHAIKYGQNIKFPGSDIEKEEVIVRSKTRIGSMEMGLLIACGYTNVNVLKEVTIGVLTIRDKSQKPGGPLRPEHSYESNRAILISLLKENGFNSADFEITTNSSTLIIQSITAALETVDLLVTTGCSKNKDCLKYILVHHFKATFHFENVNIKPGRSVTFATCTFNNKTKYILCLPGNPVSLFVTAHLFLLPLLNWMYSSIKWMHTVVMARIEQKLRLHSRPRYVLATLLWPREDDVANLICKEYESNSIDNNLSSFMHANAILILSMKTPESDLLQIPYVTAILIKFPISY